MYAAPSSLVSASDMFSPGQLMTHLLGTPTPAATPGLSPGTLNELGNMLQVSQFACPAPLPPTHLRAYGLTGCASSSLCAVAAARAAFGSGPLISCPRIEEGRGRLGTGSGKLGRLAVGGVAASCDHPQSRLYESSLGRA